MQVFKQYSNLNKKVNFALEHAMKDQWVIIGIALLFL
jgi:hypothetical protein